MHRADPKYLFFYVGGEGGLYGVHHCIIAKFVQFFGQTTDDYMKEIICDTYFFVTFCKYLTNFHLYLNMKCFSLTN